MTPAAWFDTSDRPSTARPAWRAAVTSCTVDMPTRPGAQRTQHAHLGGRLVGGAGDAGVDRLAQRAPQRRGAASAASARSAGE